MLGVFTVADGSGGISSAYRAPANTALGGGRLCHHMATMPKC